MPGPSWLLLAGCGWLQGTSTDSGSTDSTPPPTPAVVDLADPCGAGLLSGTECLTLQVTCEDLPPAVVEVRVSIPPEGVDPRLVLVVGSGGGGDSFWNSSLDVGETLTSAGYVLVDRRWQEPWMTGEAGFIRPSCRYAELLGWVRHHVSEDLPVCAIGNSLGASEVATVLVSRPELALLAGAVLSSGPPLTRLDWACLPASAPGWPAQCAELTADLGVCADATVRCDLHQDPDSEIPALIDLAFAGTPCTDQDLDFVDAFQAESTWPPEGVHRVDVPTEVLVGSEDCSEAIPFAGLFAVLSGVPTVTLEGGGHKPQTTSKGLAALMEAVERTCTP